MDKESSTRNYSFNVRIIQCIGKNVQLKLSKKSKSKTKVPTSKTSDVVYYSETAVVKENGLVEWDALQVFKFAKESAKKASSRQKPSKKQPSYVIQLSLSYYSGKKKKKLYAWKLNLFDFFKKTTYVHRAIRYKGEDLPTLTAVIVDEIEFGKKPYDDQRLDYVKNNVRTIFTATASQEGAQSSESIAQSLVSFGGDISSVQDSEASRSKGSSSSHDKKGRSRSGSGQAGNQPQPVTATINATQPQPQPVAQPQPVVVVEEENLNRIKMSEPDDPHAFLWKDMVDAPSNKLITYKVVMYGSPGVGKTQMCNMWKNKGFQSQTKSTIGVDMVGMSFQVGREIVSVNLWDTAGQERHNSLSAMHFNNAHGLVLMYDVTNKNSFDTIVKTFEQAKDYTKNDDVVVILIGNKTDYPQSDRQVRRSDAKNFSFEHGMLFTETSCLNGSNVQNAMQVLFQRMHGRFHTTAKSNSGAGNNTNSSSSASGGSARQAQPQQSSFPEAKKSEGCFAVSNEIKTKRGWSPIIYLKYVEGARECVRVGQCVLTPNHLIYTDKCEVQPASLSGQPVADRQHVRGVMVRGDSFYCAGQLVSSHTHCKQLVYLSPILDYTPSALISVFDNYLCPWFEPLFEAK